MNNIPENIVDKEENGFGGLDLGNRYAKLTTCMGSDEIIVAYRELSKADYKEFEASGKSERVKYKDRYFVVGETGEHGIGHENKAAESYKEISNMFKLVLLARDMKKRNIVDFEYKIKTGTPYDDFERYKDGYIELMKSPKGDYEFIELDGVEYKIKVTHASITKQCACAIFTMPDRKNKDYLIWDWGGGTLDISLFKGGKRKMGHSVDFSLNEEYVKLGKKLRAHMDIKPAIDNTEFIEDMEKLKLEGHYKGDKHIKIDDKPIKEFVSKHYQAVVDDIVSKSLRELKLNSYGVAQLDIQHIGGGAKLLEHEIANNQQIGDNSSISELAEFRNSVAFYVMAKATTDWE